MLLLWGCVAFLIALLLSRWLAAHPHSFDRLDHPNERSLHRRPTPRTGGLAIMAALITGGAGVMLLSPPPGSWFWLLAGLFMIALISFLDDRKHLAPGLRLLIHLCAAALLSMSGWMSIELLLPEIHLTLSPWMEVVFALLFVVWMTNLYNFMDGMDGFAGGMAVVGFGCLAVFGALAGDSLFTGMNLVVACACAGFLLVNFPPACLFMGDLGSSSLGFLVAAFSLWGQRVEIFPLWVPLLVFSPFIVDASLTLLRRLLKGEKVWTPHHSHYYQRLVRLGWGHRTTVLSEYLLMLACAASALYASRADTASQWWIVCCWVIVYGLLVLIIERRWRREQAGS